MTRGTRSTAPASFQQRVRVAAVLLLLVAAALPLGADAGTSSWDTLATDLPQAVRGIDIRGDTGWAVGDGGLILELVDDTWVARSSPTTRDLHDVAVRDATHAVAVGDGGIILEYEPQGSGGTPAWTISAAAGSLGISALHGAAFLDDTPLAVGTGGQLVIGQAADWVVRTIASGKTLRGIDVKESLGAAYVVGSATGGDSGAVMYRYLNGNTHSMTIPTGTYGLHDIDIGACRAVGSGGRILRCLDGDPTTWLGHTVQTSFRFEHVAKDPNQSGRAWAAGQDGNGDGILYFTDNAGDSESWSPRVLPATGPVTALSAGAGGIVTALLDQILAFRPHAPEFTSMPASTTGYQGETITVPFSASDDDGDPLIPDIFPDDPLPPGVLPPDIRRIADYIWELIWVPPYDLEGIFNFTIVITDGDRSVSNGTKIIILDENGPPYWDPHPDVVIPYGIPYTTQAQAHDPDNDPLTLTGPSIPPGSMFQDLGGGLAQLDWTPTIGDVGDHFVTFTADDGNATGDLDFMITVVDNLPPVIDWHPVNGSTCVKGAFHDGQKTFSAGATDPEGGPVTYEWFFSDDGSTEIGTPVQHTYTIIGIHTVTLTVTDDIGLTDSVQFTVRADDCVRLEVTPDRECFDIIDEATGVIRFYNHLGQPINGTYEMRAEWKNVLEQTQSQRVTGTITDGFAVYNVPHDNDPIPLGDHGTHRLYFKAFYPNSPLGDTETAAATVSYFMSYHCALVKDAEGDPL